MRIPRRILLHRYVLPPVLVVVAHLLTRLLWTVMEGNLSLLFLTAVMVSALRGGLMAGLIASLLAGLTCAIFYYPPDFSPLVSFGDLLRTTAFVAIAVFVSWLSAARQRSEEALRESQAALERRVEERTAELRLANERLEGEVAERKRAEFQIMAYQERLRSASGQQHAIPRVLMPYLRRVDYDSVSGLAHQWSIGDDIGIDPTRAMGKPIVRASAMPTAVLAAAYR